MSQTVSPEGMADSQGANASMAFGAVGAEQAAANSLKSTNPAAYAGAQEPGQGPGAPPALPTSPGAPVGPAPSIPSQAPPNPGPASSGPDLSDFPNMDEGQPWRQRLKVWATPEHPYLSHFADLANRDAKRHDRQP